MPKLTYLTLVLAAAALAQDKLPAGDFGRAPLKAPSTVTSRIEKAGANAVTSSSLREVIAREVVVAPGDVQIFASSFDFSGAAKVAIAVTSLSDPASTFAKIRLVTAWAAPGDWFVGSDMIFGSNFIFTDAGGATVPVYGQALKVAVFNDSAKPVRITQLSVYAVAR